jgi:hypothetical protein
MEKPMKVLAILLVVMCENVDTSLVVSFGEKGKN